MILSDVSALLVRHAVVIVTAVTTEETTATGEMIAEMTAETIATDGTVTIVSVINHVCGAASAAPFIHETNKLTPIECWLLLTDPIFQTRFFVLQQHHPLYSFRVTAKTNHQIDGWSQMHYFDIFSFAISASCNTPDTLIHARSAS